MFEIRFLEIFFCFFFKKNVSWKKRVSYDLKTWATVFRVLNFEVKWTTLLIIMGRRTCSFVLLINTYVTLIKCRRQKQLCYDYQFLKLAVKWIITWKFEAFMPMYHKIAPLPIFSKICQKCILFSRYFLIPLTPAIFYYCA